MGSLVSSSRRKHRERGLRIAVRAAHYEECEFLIKRVKVNSNAQNKRGMAALHIAAWHNSIDIAMLLVNFGCAELELGEEHNNTALHIACFRGNVEMVQFLVGVCKANVNAMNNFGLTPLHFACWKRYEQIGMWLVETSQAATHRVDKYGRSALRMAKESGCIDLAVLIAKRTTGENLLVLLGARHTRTRQIAAPVRYLPIELIRLVGLVL